MTNYTLADAAKLLGTGRNRLTSELKKCGVLDHNRLPAQRHIDAGHFITKLKQHTKNPHMNQGKGQLYYQTLVTQKGLRWLANKMGVQIEDADQEHAA